MLPSLTTCRKCQKGFPYGSMQTRTNQVIGLVLPFLSLDQCRDCEVNEFCFLSKTSSRQPVPPALGTSIPIGRPGTKTWTSPCISIWQSPSGNYTKKSITMWPTTQSTSWMMAMWQRISRLQCFISIYHLAMPKTGPKIYFPKG